MTNSAFANGDEPDAGVTDAGASTDQHVTDAPETGTFTTDEPPRSDTPADGSSNVGVNETRANRRARDD